MRRGVGTDQAPASHVLARQWNFELFIDQGDHRQPVRDVPHRFDRSKWQPARPVLRWREAIPVTLRVKKPPLGSPPRSTGHGISLPTSTMGRRPGLSCQGHRAGRSVVSQFKVKQARHLLLTTAIRAFSHEQQGVYGPDGTSDPRSPEPY